MILDEDGEDPKPVEAEEPPRKQSLNDYKITVAERLPKETRNNAPWLPLPHSAWDRMAEYRRQSLAHQSSPWSQPVADIQLIASDDDIWGSVGRVTVEWHKRYGRHLIGLHLPRERGGQELHRLRAFNPEAASFILTLLLPGGSLGFNDDGSGRTHLYYSGLKGEKIPLRRLLFPTKPGQRETDPKNNPEYGFRSYLAEDRGEPKRDAPSDFSKRVSWTDQDYAFRLARQCFEERGGDPRGILDSGAYEEMLRGYAETWGAYLTSLQLEWAIAGRLLRAGHPVPRAPLTDLPLLPHLTAFPSHEAAHEASHKLPDGL